MRERLKPDTPISARAWPPRIPLHLNDALTVWPTKSDDARNPRASRERGRSGSPTAMSWPLAEDRRSEERGAKDEESA